jgi:hypothetical protein
MVLDKLVMGVLLFSLILVSGLFIIGDVNSSYDDVSLDTSKFDKIGNQTDEIFNLTNNMKEDVFGETEEDTIVDSMFKGAYTALRVLKGMFELVGSTIGAVLNEIGIANAGLFSTVALTAFSIIIVFSVLYMIFRFKP